MEGGRSNPNIYNIMYPFYDVDQRHRQVSAGDIQVHQGQKPHRVKTECGGPT